jgi:hypothetical protein
MQEARESVHCAADAICDGLRQLGDVSYAILPKDIAHALADLKKSLLTNIRGVIDWEMGWIDERVAGGDKLRQEWQEKCKQQTSTGVPPESAA